MNQSMNESIEAEKHTHSNLIRGRAFTILPVVVVSTEWSVCQLCCQKVGGPKKQSGSLIPEQGIDLFDDFPGTPNMDTGLRNEEVQTQ